MSVFTPEQRTMFECHICGALPGRACRTPAGNQIRLQDTHGLRGLGEGGTWTDVYDARDRDHKLRFCIDPYRKQAA